MFISRLKGQKQVVARHVPVASTKLKMSTKNDNSRHLGSRGVDINAEVNAALGSRLQTDRQPRQTESVVSESEPSTEVGGLSKEDMMHGMKTWITASNLESNLTEKFRADIKAGNGSNYGVTYSSLAANGVEDTLLKMSVRRAFHEPLHDRSNDDIRIQFISVKQLDESITGAYFPATEIQSSSRTSSTWENRAQEDELDPSFTYANIVLE
eukprot:GHVH01005953.1.p1 GENE.GHVH01005953.1~~GHVH01005953.1.p1  ORF type:complete len:211 (+),score=32.10 GHVH01005953.1:58-690(+)